MFTREELDAVEAVGRNWEFLTERDVPTEGVHTPTGPRRDLWDSPELWIIIPNKISFIILIV